MQTEYQWIGFLKAQMWLANNSRCLYFGSKTIFLSPPPLLKIIFSPPLASCCFFQLLSWPFYINYSQFYIYFTLLSFSFPFPPFLSPFSFFFSPLFFLPFSFTFSPFFSSPFHIFTQKTSADNWSLPKGGRRYFPAYRPLNNKSSLCEATLS